jgi:hypothetical protein
MKAAERVTLRELREAEWRTITGRLATYTPIPAERADTPDPRVVLWSFGRRAVLTEAPAVAASLGPWAATWYAARRDANLLQRCPICGAAGMVTDMRERPWCGQMVHERRCPVGDHATRRLRITPYPGATA